MTNKSKGKQLGLTTDEKEQLISLLDKMDIENFRSQLKKMRERLRKVYIYKLSLAYGVVKEENNDIKFYFEKCERDVE